MKNNTAPIRLLLLNDSSNDAEYVLNILRKGGFATRPKLIEFGTEFKDAINQQIWDLILTTTMVGNTSATLILDILNRMDLDIPTIILTHESSEEETTKFLRDGAKDVVLLERNRHLLFVIQRELDNLSERRTRRRHEISIREFQRRTKGLLETLQDAVAYVLDGMHIHVNPVYLKLFGFKKMEELESVPIMDLIVPENQADFKTFLQGLRNHQEQKIKSIELVGLGPHGKFNVKMEFSPAIFEGEECHQVVTRDLSHWVDINKLNLIAQQDNLTALYSHQYFLQALDEAVTAAVEEEQRGFLIYLEIDNFRTIKETVGVAASDEIIKDIADILRDKISTGQILARFADATFTLLSKGNDIEPVREFAET
ncbi:MAG: diguanylate cyclase, partial [Gammaproteobacteria bacterium]|nr:diguanylate cyclase [Gammaproteobacteria bacterium]